MGRFWKSSEVAVHFSLEPHIMYALKVLVHIICAKCTKGAKLRIGILSVTGELPL